MHLGAVLTFSVLVPHAAMHPCSSWWRKGGRAPRAQHTHSPLSPRSAHTPFYLQTAHTLCTSICCRCDLLWIGLGELCANGMADFNSCSLAAVSSIKNALFTKPAITWTAQKKNQISSCHSLKIRNVLSLHSAKQPLPLPESSQEQVQGSWW